MTLSRVEVMLADAFEYGQAYVALSRATSLQGLWLSGPCLSASCVKAHPDVIRFYSAAEASSSCNPKTMHNTVGGSGSGSGSGSGRGSVKVGQKRPREKENLHNFTSSMSRSSAVEDFT
jgi:hypothetical protein